jgi:hypothetical protein
MSIDERVDDLLGQMTVEEKVSLLAGCDLWRKVILHGSPEDIQ